MSHHINDQIKEAILEEVESMTVGEFQKMRLTNLELSETLPLMKW